MEIFEPHEKGCYPMVNVQPVMNYRGELWRRKTVLADGPPPPKNVKNFTSINLRFPNFFLLIFGGKNMFKRFCKFTRNPFHCFYNKGE
jgi:hypothetical protein